MQQLPSLALGISKHSVNAENTASDFRTVFFLWSALLTETSVVNQNMHPDVHRVQGVLGNSLFWVRQG